MWFPILGIALILGGCVVASKHRNAIDVGLIVRAVCLQWLLAIVLFKLPAAQATLQWVGHAVEQLQAFSLKGAAFVFGGFASQPETLVKLFGQEGGFVFAMQMLPVIVFVASLVAYFYHIGWLPRFVQALSWVVNRLLGVSGAEALSNTASVFVGQVESQLLIKPYLATLTPSELLAVMAGGLACISGGMMAVYIAMGIQASYLLTASMMAIPAAFAISKLLIPETGTPQTRAGASLKMESKAANWVDALAQGAGEGWHIGVCIIAMLIAFISLVAMLDAGLGVVGKQLMAWGVASNALGLHLEALSLSSILGWAFYGVAVLMGVPPQEASLAGGLLGTKLVLNEFVAYSQLLALSKAGALSPLTQAILSVALCGFANLGSVAILLGGLGAMVPERRADIAKMGLLAMVAGSLASYVSGAMMGILHQLDASLLPAWAWSLFALVLLVILVLSHRFPKQAQLPSASLTPSL